MSSYIINNTNINYNRNKICNQTATSLLELDSNIPYNIFIRNLKSLKAGQVVVNFDIILEKNRIIFHGSRDDSKIRTVRGKVRLEVAGKLNVKEIILSLVGDYNISLDLMNDISSSLSPSSPTSSTSSLESLESSLPEKQGTVFSSSILLENKRVLLSGIHEFHFEFLLPGDLSESMNSDAVLCKYFLKAELMTRFPSELSTDNNKSVDIVDLFIERAFLESDDDITNGLRPTRFIGGNNDLLDFEFILPKIMKLNSNSIEFIGRWDGFNRVDKISFCFVQSECYNIANNGCIVHNEKSIAGPFCFQLPKNEPLRLQSRPTIFKLPICESFVNDYDLVNIKIRHQLDVKIQLNNFKKDQIEFSIPISVKSIIPNQDTLPLPHKIDLSNSVACLQLGNEIYTSKPSKEANIINKQPIFKSPSIIFNNVNNREINVSHNMNISTNTDSNVTRQSKPLPNIRKQLLQFLSRKTSIQSKKSSSKKSLPINIESKIFNNDDDGNDNDNDIINNINNNSNSDSNGSSSSNIINNKIMNNLCNSRISTITEASSEFSIENVAIIEEEEEEEDDDDEYIENINHDIEYDNDDTDDIKANDTIITAATATTYTDNNFNVKEFHKPDFITSSANIIAENFIKFNYLLHKRHHQNNKDNINKTNNYQQQYKNHHKPPPKSHQNKSHQNKSLKRNSRISRASSTSTCVQPDVKDYIKHSTHYKSDNNNNIIINDNIIIS